MKVVFYYVRHGQTRFNEKGRMQGVCDSPLTQQGIKQAESAQQALRDVYFDHVYSSPSGRCLSTAKIILKGRKMEPVVLSSLHEVDFGRLEGSRVTSHPDEIKSCLEKQDYTSVNGESKYSVYERIDASLSTILSDCKDGDHVLLVSHGGFEMSFMEHALHVNLDELFSANAHDPIPNAGIMCFVYEDDTFTMLLPPTKAQSFIAPKEEKNIHFYYVNHGQTRFNQYNRMQGVSDSPLTERGMHEIQRCAELLKDTHFDAIYTSPLMRSLDTAMMIAHDRNITPILCKGLQEIDYGMFEGIVRDSWLKEIQEHRTKHDDWSDVGGESREAFELRVKHTFAKIVCASKDQSTILIVGHSEYYKRLLEILFGLQAEEEMTKLREEGKQPHPYGGIARFDYVDGKWSLKQYMSSQIDEKSA